LAHQFFCTSLQPKKWFHTCSKTPVMSDIQNVGKKGYCMLYFFIFFLLFIVLVISVYKYNGNFLGN